MASLKFHVLKVVGNFGIAFCSPIAGMGIGDLYLQIVDLNFNTILTISAISAIFTTLLSVFKGLKEYGETGGKHK